MNFLRNLRVHRLPHSPNKGVIIAEGRVIFCALGRGSTSVLKREGDGTTPAQTQLRPLFGFYRADKVARPISSIPFNPIVDNDGWCDDSYDPNYNLPVKLPYPCSHEKMKREDHLYDIGLVLDWNMPLKGRKRHLGSAIFLHLSRPDYSPTEGCIAIKQPDMRWLLRHICVRTSIFVQR